jgi:AraC-like DNA-binding protein
MHPGSETHPPHPPAPPLPVAELEHCAPRLQWVYRGVIDPAYRDARQLIPAEDLACWLILADEVLLGDGSRVTPVRTGEIAIISNLDFDARWSPNTRLVSVRLRLPAAHAPRLFHAPGLLHLRRAEAPALFRATRALGDWSARHLPDARTRFQSQAVSPDAWLDLQTRYSAWLAALHTTLAPRHRVAEPLLPLDSRVRQTTERVRDHPWIPERQLAAEVGLSLSQLQRLFRQQLGRPIHRFADEARLRRAQALLAAPDILMKEVAARTGFASAQTFARWFRQRAGCSPTDYQTRAGRLV